MNIFKLSLNSVLMASLFLAHSALASQHSSEPEIAIGTYSLDNYWSQASILNNNHDGSWSFQSAPWGAPLSGSLHELNCKGSTCIATATNVTTYDGRYAISPPLFLMSSDYGKNWYVNKNISGLPEMIGGHASSISCTDKMCVAGGSYEDRGIRYVPMLLTSYDHGQSWSYVHNLPLPVSMPNTAEGYLSAVECTGGICITGGSYLPSGIEQKLMLFRSENNGQSWLLTKAITGLPANMSKIHLKYIKCNNNACVATGWYGTTDERGYETGDNIFLWE